jgi:hypothetical protein
MSKKLLLALVSTLALSNAPAFAQMGPQPSLPMVVDFKKVPIGSWASYTVSAQGMVLNSKVALVARDATSVSLETSTEGGPMAMMGGKVAVKLVMDPDPLSAAKPVKQVIMQVGEQDPMLAPDGVQAQQYTKPDPSTLVGKETIKVAAGSFKTAHYRYKTEQSTVDVWASEDVPPTGMVKLVTTGQQGMTMELQALGKGAKSIITKPPQPFDQGKLMGGAPAPSKKKGKR